MFGFLLGEALRDLRRAGRVAVSAIMLITLSLAALGAFWLLSSNLGQAVAQFRERVKIVVYLKREPPAAEANALAERVRRMPGVAVGALCRQDRGARRAETGARQGRRRRRFAGRRTRCRRRWRSRRPPRAPRSRAPARWSPGWRRCRRRTRSAGAWTGSSASPTASGCSGSSASASAPCWPLAAILTVTTATTLVLHARRGEMEIMRLVGAPEHVVRMPLLLQGMMQGLDRARCWPSGC